MYFEWSEKILKFFNLVLSYLIALGRLLLWTVIFFFSGLQRTLFMRSEVDYVEFRVIPLRCDCQEADDKLAYIDKLCTENPDLNIVDDIPEDGNFDEGDEE